MVGSVFAACVVMSATTGPPASDNSDKIFVTRRGNSGAGISA
jgi:hypothetical protein